MKNFYLKLYDLISRFHLWIILAAISLSIVAGFFVSKIQFDMSFRPLFADEDEMFIPTQNFEDIFGEASGAHIGVILESENILIMLTITVPVAPITKYIIFLFGAIFILKRNAIITSV